jgi:hypothetical protein
VKHVKEHNIYSNIIPIYYLSKLTGLAPLSLAYTRDKDMRIHVRLRSSVFAMFYGVFLVLVIIAGQCCVFIFNYRLPGKSETKILYLSGLLIIGASSVTSLVLWLTKLRKVIDNLLNNGSVLDDLFRTNIKELKSKENFLQIQVMSVIANVCVLYLNDLFSFYRDFDTTIIFPITTYICTSIEFVTIAQFVNLILLLKQKFQIINRYTASGKNSSEHEDDCNLWETVLQTSCFRNLSNL